MRDKELPPPFPPSRGVSLCTCAQEGARAGGPPGSTTRRKNVVLKFLKDDYQPCFPPILSRTVRDGQKICDGGIDDGGCKEMRAEKAEEAQEADEEGQSNERGEKASK